MLNQTDQDPDLLSLLRSCTAFHYADFQCCDVFDCVRNFVSGDINLYLIFLLFSKLKTCNKKLVGKFYGFTVQEQTIEAESGVYLLHIRSKNEVQAAMLKESVKLEYIMFKFRYVETDLANVDFILFSFLFFSL